MPRISLDHQLATRADMPALGILMNAAIGEHQKPLLTAEQIASGREIMGLDTQLVDYGTYFIVEQNGVLAGAADGVGAQPSTAATVHPGAMQRCLTQGKTLRVCVPCIRIPASSAEAWVV